MFMTSFLVDSNYRSTCAKLICPVEERNQENWEKISHHCKLPNGRDRACYVLGTEKERARDQHLIYRWITVILSSLSAWSLWRTKLP